MKTHLVGANACLKSGGAAQQVSLHFAVDKSDNSYSNILGFHLLGDAAAADANVSEDEKRFYKAWNKECDKHEPPKVEAFRESLYTCPCVKQLYDPWYMDDNTRDKVPAQPNTQKTSNETLHAHHLHITVLDTKVLP